MVIISSSGSGDLIQRSTSQLDPPGSRNINGSTSSADIDIAPVKNHDPSTLVQQPAERVPQSSPSPTPDHRDEKASITNMNFANYQIEDAPLSSSDDCLEHMPSISEGNDDEHQCRRRSSTSSSEFSYGYGDDNSDSDDSDQINAGVLQMLRKHQRASDNLAQSSIPKPATGIKGMAGSMGNTRRKRVPITMANNDDDYDVNQERMASSMRREAITTDVLDLIGDHLDNLELWIQVKDWLTSFRDLDPRYQILNFFNDLSLEGVDKFEEEGCSDMKGVVMLPKLLRMFIKNGIFSVWRPTSSESIRKMIAGEGVGKGLDIKGKSAKCGAFSGFVPFLQIHDNEHKKKIAPMRKHERVRVFYPNETSRDIAYETLNELGDDMSKMANLANKFISSIEKGEDDKRRSKMLFMGGKTSAYEESKRCLMSDPSLYEIDDYVSTQGVYGLDIPEKLFWEAYVVPNDITREPGSKYETGRPSMPEFQQMNIDTLRNWSDEPTPLSTNDLSEEADPRPVLWHGGCGGAGKEMPQDSNPLCPLSLLMAYEENNQVIPVVSDFDCFLLGTRGVRYNESFGEQELSMLSMCIKEIEGILETQEEGGNWTQRWLQVKKKQAGDKHSHVMPKFGYADPRSYKIMTGAVGRLKSNGAVRHGPECFNYGFPQDLDDEFLVISDTFPGVPWRYANAEQLIDILSEKIDQGFTFPLNPKWILCDKGWKQLYDNLLASEKPNVQDSMNIWYPPDVRNQINDISTKYPEGFVPTATENSSASGYSSGVQIDLAQLELKRYETKLKSEKKIFRAMKSISSAHKFRNEVARSHNKLQYMKQYQSARTFKDEVNLNVSARANSNANKIILEEEEEEEDKLSSINTELKGNLSSSMEGISRIMHEESQNELAMSKVGRKERGTTAAPPIRSRRATIGTEMAPVFTTSRSNNDGDRVEGSLVQSSGLASNCHAATTIDGERVEGTLMQASGLASNGHAATSNNDGERVEGTVMQSSGLASNGHAATSYEIKKGCSQTINESSHTEGSTDSKGKSRLRKLRTKKILPKAISRRFGRRLSGRRLSTEEAPALSVSEHQGTNQNHTKQKGLKTFARSIIHRRETM